MFDNNFLKKLEYLLIVSRRTIRSGFTGNGKSGSVEIFTNRRKPQFNGGTDFADHRVYVKGDDLRRLDWNLFARLGEQFIKRFETNEELNIYFLLDCSASMQAGNGNFNKYNYARRVIASLAYIALSDFNRVGIVCFDNMIRRTFSPIRGKRKFLNLLKFLERNQSTENATNIRLSVENFIKQTQRTGAVIIASDFFDRNGFQTAIDQLRYNKFEPMIIQIHTDFESDPQLQFALSSNAQTNFNLVSMENETITINGKTNSLNNNEINVTINESMLNQYKICFADFLEEIRKYCVKNGIGCAITNTLLPYDKLILQMINNGNILNHTYLNL
ncbi:MAG: DUF58 domain-containing protein [Planctomycetaceae bacterium]|jgi:hypothetical protein|nr:DUF58 domain-containing protein [Planctomycetaceae bacterium]